MAAPNPRLIRLVTARYHQMQGLVTMAGAGFPLLQGTARLIPDDRWSWWLVLAFAASLCGYLYLHVSWLRRRIPEYYANRFGRVGRTPFTPNPLGLWLSMAISYNQIFRDWFHMPAGVRSLVMMFMLCIYPAWVAIRDLPYRAYWFLLVVVGGYAALDVPRFAARDFLPVWSRNANLSIGCALVIVGALDHWLLSRALNGGAYAHPMSAVEESDDPSCI